MLLLERRFLPLFVTQFLGALNDNVLRNALIVLLTFQAANWTTLQPEILANLVTGIFVLPLFLFSATAGQLADKFDKARLARICKLNEIGIVLVASAGGGAITLGAMGIALAGCLASRAIPPAAPTSPDLKISLNPVSATWSSVDSARQNRSVFLAILGISWFWLYGAMFLAQFPAYTRNVLGGDELAVTLLLVTFTLGIGVGSLLCARLSAGRVKMGLVSFGAIGLTLFALDLAYASPGPIAKAALLSAAALLTQPGVWRVLADLILLGVCGGLFSVPLYTLIQQSSSDDCRARIIGANNALNAMFMVLGALTAAAMLANGTSIPALFGVAALCNAAVTAFICRGLRGAQHEAQR